MQTTRQNREFRALRRRMRSNWALYALLLIPLVYIILFAYMPMYGAQIAFRNYSVARGIWSSPWVGFKHVRSFFGNYMFWRLMRNTVWLSVYSILTFPFPILFALLLQYNPVARFRKGVQLTTYAPHFISNVVMCGMILEFLSVRGGAVNLMLHLIGLDTVDFMGDPSYFASVYVWSGLWQSLGYSSIIYISALSSVDPELHEAATIDGAVIAQRIWHIDLPGMLPMIMVMLVLRCGQLLNVGYEKVLLLQNDLNYSASEVIQTYVWKMGITAQLPHYSYASAVGLFTSVINLAMLVLVNVGAKRLSGSALW